MKESTRPSVDHPNAEPSKEAGSATPSNEIVRTPSITSRVTSSTAANQSRNTHSPRPVGERKPLRRVIKEI